MNNQEIPQNNFTQTTSNSLLNQQKSSKREIIEQHALLHPKTLVQSHDDNLLSLRKNNIYKTLMKSRLSINKPSQNEHINNEYEKYISKDFLLAYSNSQTKISILQTILLSDPPDPQYVLFAIHELIDIISNNNCTFSNDLLLSITKSFCDEYFNPEITLQIRKDLLFLLINISFKYQDVNTSLYDQLFTSNILNILLSDTYPLSMKIDSLWLLNNLIKTQCLFNLIIYPKVDAILTKIMLIFNLTDIEQYYSTLLNFLLMYLQFIPEHQSKFHQIVNQLVNIMSLQFRNYYLLCGNQQETTLNENKKMLYRNIKYFLKLFAFVSNKYKTIAISLTSNNVFLNIIKQFLLEISQQNVIVSHHNKNTINVTLSSKIKLNILPHKVYKHNLFMLEPILIYIMDIIVNLTYYTTGELFKKIKEQNYLLYLQTILEKYIINTSSNLPSSDLLCYLCSFLKNILYESESSSFGMIVNSSIMKYLLMLIKAKNADEPKKNFITLVIDWVDVQDNEKILFYLINDLDVIKVFSLWLIDKIEHKNNYELIKELINAFRNVLGMVAYKKKYNAVYQHILNIMSENGVVSALENMLVDKQCEISEIAEALLQNFDLDNRIDFVRGSDEDDDELNQEEDYIDYK